MKKSCKAIGPYSSFNFSNYNKYFWTCYHDNTSREAIETFICAHNLNRDEFYKENKEWLCKEDWFNEKEWE